MLRTTANLLLCVGTLLAVPAGAEPLTGTAMAMPPPPGPYLSSRPQLNSPERAQRNDNRPPFMGSVPAMPMGTMPLPRQVPVPAPWWRDPMGR
jgi:hypothetical protein